MSIVSSNPVSIPPGTKTIVSKNSKSGNTTCCSLVGQSMTTKTMKKALDDAIENLEKCNREDYATEEEFQAAYKFRLHCVQELEKQYSELDQSSTKTNSNAICQVVNTVIGPIKDLIGIFTKTFGLGK